MTASPIVTHFFVGMDLIPVKVDWASTSDSGCSNNHG